MTCLTDRVSVSLSACQYEVSKNNVASNDCEILLVILENNTSKNVNKNVIILITFIHDKFYIIANESFTIFS